MRAHDSDRGYESELRPKASRMEQPESARALKAALSGRLNAAGTAGVIGLQRAVGNAAAARLIEDERSPVHDVIGSGGAPLPADVRADMEGRFGQDFGDVRVHNDGAAHESAKAVNAQAYTVGSNIVFQRDTYDPGSAAGKHMIAHELTHVVQQRNGPVDGTDAGGGVKISDPSDRFERDAVASADRLMSAPAAAAAPCHDVQRLVAGMQLLAHEAAHAVQQADQPPGDTAEPDELKVSDPSDASEQAADRAATDVMMDRRVNRQSLSGASAPAQIQRKRTKMSLDFLPSGSYVTFTPDGLAFSPATKKILDHTDFPDGYTGEVRIDADTKAIVRIGMKLYIFEDNWIKNEKLNQSVFVDWSVSAARDGKLTIDPAAKIWRGTPSSGKIKAGLTDINPSPGADYVMINPVVASGGGTGGISLGVEVTENAPAQSVSAPFTLRIVVENIPPPKEPTGTVTIGEISALRTHQVRFPAPKHGKGQFTVPSDEITKFSVWYSSLKKKTRERIEKGELAVELTAYTSTTGDIAYNDWLSDERRKSVEQLLGRRAGSDARIERSRALGKLDTPTPDLQESAEWRKVVISVFDVMSEGENPPGSTPP